MGAAVRVSMTAEERRVRLAIKRFAEGALKKRVTGIRHVFPRAYVLARPAPGALILVRPWVDAEPHLRADSRQCGSVHVTAFDPGLQAGDWCAVAYVSTWTSGEHVAVPLEAKR